MLAGDIAGMTFPVAASTHELSARVPGVGLQVVHVESSFAAGNLNPER